MNSFDKKNKSSHQITASSSFSLLRNQANLKIGEPNDKYEQEADRMEDLIMQMPEPQVQRQTEQAEERKENLVRGEPISHQVSPFIQLQAGQQASVIPKKETNINRLRVGGQPLSKSTRDFFEPRFGHDFSQVRVHTNPLAEDTAKSLNANAFTIGQNIVFGAAPYSPATDKGRRLLAHELTHVVQQRAAVPLYADSRKSGHSLPGESMAEDGQNPLYSHHSLYSSKGYTSTQSIMTPLIQRKGPANTEGLLKVTPIQLPPQLNMSVFDIAMNNFEKMRGMLTIFQGALDIFGSVVNANSKEEAALKKDSLIVIDELSKFVFGKVTGFASATLPGGKIAEDTMNFLTKISNAITAEKKRSSAATINNTLMIFITSLVSTVTTAKGTIDAHMRQDANTIRTLYNKQNSDLEKNAFKDRLEDQNHKLETQLMKGPFTVDALFERISQSWINKNSVPGKKVAARIEIVLDSNWEVISAYINAPRGSRIAEHLLRISPGGKFDLIGFGVPLRVEWRPSNSPWARLWAIIPADGEQASSDGSTLAGKEFEKEFANNLATRPLPKTATLTGHKTS